MNIRINKLKTGEMIMNKLKHNNISISDLSISTGINKQVLNSYINGDKKISLNNLIKICNLLEVLVDDILIYDIV